MANPNGLPVTADELDRHCALMTEAINCTQDYSHRCLMPMLHRLTEMFTGEIEEMKEEFCTNGTEFRANFVRHAPCLRRVQKESQKTCLTQFQAGFESAQRSEANSRVAKICCNANRLRKCFFDKIGAVCGDEAVQFADGTMQRAFSRVSRMLCHEYDAFSDKCAGALPPPDAAPKGE